MSGSITIRPNQISRSAIAALTFPAAPVAIMRVVEMGAPHRLARNAARASLSGGAGVGPMRHKLPIE